MGPSGAFCGDPPDIPLLEILYCRGWWRSPWRIALFVLGCLSFGLFLIGGVYALLN